MESYRGTMKNFLEKLNLQSQKENKYDTEQLEPHKDRVKSKNEYDFNCLVTNLSVIDLNFKFESQSLLKIKMSVN